MASSGVRLSTEFNQRRHEEIFRIGPKYFFDKDRAEDPWEVEFLLFYDEFRSDVMRAIEREDGALTLLREVASITKLSTQRTGRRQIFLRETAMNLANELRRLATAVLAE